jgi:hypothetical protein
VQHQDYDMFLLAVCPEDFQKKFSTLWSNSE